MASSPGPVEAERAIAMAREIRAGQADYSPYELYEASRREVDLYSHAMREAGYVVPKSGRAPSTCDVCGYEFGRDAPRKAVSTSAPEAERCACGRPSMYMTGECDRCGVRFK